MSTGPTGPKGATGAAGSTGPTGSAPIFQTAHGTILQRNAIPLNQRYPGLFFYATDVLQLQFWNGKHWIEVVQGPVLG